MSQNIKSNTTSSTAIAEAAIQNLIQQLSMTWDRGDANAFASLFTEDADYIAFDGSNMKGRKAIEEGHDPLFKRFLRGSKLVTQDFEIRMLAPEVGLIHSKGYVLPRFQKKPSKRRLSVQTLVATRQNNGADGAWLFTAFQNTRYRPFDENPFIKIMMFLSAKKSQNK